MHWSGYFDFVDWRVMRYILFLCSAVDILFTLYISPSDLVGSSRPKVIYICRDRIYSESFSLRVRLLGLCLEFRLWRYLLITTWDGQIYFNDTLKKKNNGTLLISEQQTVQRGQLMRRPPCKLFAIKVFRGAVSWLDIHADYLQYSS